MEMRFFWVADQVKNGSFDVQWHPGQENLADYFTKHFESRHHQEVRPWYLHMNNSPNFLPRAVAPSSLRGCIGTLPNRYHKSAPLPRINPRVNPTLSRVQYRALKPLTCHRQTKDTALDRLNGGRRLVAMAA